MKYIYILWERKINPDGTLEQWLLEWWTESPEEGNQWIGECDNNHLRKREKVGRINFNNSIGTSK